MIIQQAKKSDLATILVLQKQCYQQEAAIYEDYQIPPLVQTIQSIQTDFEQQVFLKLVEQEQIIGSVRGYIEKDICKVGRLIVHPDFQNKGYGKQLMKAIEKEFPTANQFELFTGHRSIKNLSFYKKLGYQEFQQQKIHDRLTLVYLKKNFHK